MTKLIVPKARASAHIHEPISTSVVNKDSIESMTVDKDKKVSGTFVNIECPGQPAKICCKLYKGMQYFSKVFEDNEKATIPLSVARFINERCQNSKHEYLQDDKGQPIKSDKVFARYKFMIENYA